MKSNAPLKPAANASAGHALRGTRSPLATQRTRTGHLIRPERQPRRNARLPTRGDPQGNGDPVVVSGRESRPQGEGGQVNGMSRGEGTRDATGQHHLEHPSEARVQRTVGNATMTLPTDVTMGRRQERVHWRAGCIERCKSGCASRKGWCVRQESVLPG